MALKIIRNDITKMDCDAVVNTANEYPAVGRGCDTAIYEAAGYDQLLAYRKEKIGRVREGEVFLTPGFNLPARNIIHAVSPAYRGGKRGEEKKLRSCYRKSLELAYSKGFKSIAFPLIATGSYHYPKEAGMRIAVDEINAFLLLHSMQVYLVVYDDAATQLGRKLCPTLESYIDHHFVDDSVYDTAKLNSTLSEEFDISAILDGNICETALFEASEKSPDREPGEIHRDECVYAGHAYAESRKESAKRKQTIGIPMPARKEQKPEKTVQASKPADFYSVHDRKLAERMKHLSDTFSEYLLYLIKSKGMTNSEVYKRAIVDKKVFSRIKNNKDAHPQKITAMCLCVGAQLSMDETRDLLARAGYALSPSNKTDVIFSYFIENGIYDMIELDIQLEEYGQPCLIE